MAIFTTPTFFASSLRARRSFAGVRLDGRRLHRFRHLDFEFVGLVCAGDLPDDGSVIIAKQFARLPEIDFDLHRFNASINSGP